MSDEEKEAFCKEIDKLYAKLNTYRKLVDARDFQYFRMIQYKLSDIMFSIRSLDIK